MQSLSTLLAPRSIAVVGASDTATKIGGIPVDFQRRFGFAGALYPVNPNAPTVQGLQAYPTLQSIGQPIDLAIVALPASAVHTVVADAVAAKVRSLLVFSSGFAEMGQAGAAAQAHLSEQVREAGLRLLGPNCLGFINVREHVYATFSPAPLAGLVRAGDIGLVSQSGAFGAYAYTLARERGLGFSKWITTGNEGDVDFADCLEWLAHDPDTRVIMGYMEGCRDGARLRRALAAAHAARKPVVIVKVGRTERGAQAASSHTAALAGNDAVFETIFKEYGVYRARDIADFFGVAAALSISKLPTDRSLGLFTVSGGVGVLMADTAVESELDLREMPAQAQATLRGWVPFAAPANPVDITGQVTNDLGLIERAARLMLDEGRYANWLCFLAAAGASDRFWPVLQSLAENLRRDYPERLLAFSTVLSAPRQRELEAQGCLVFAEPAEAVRTIAAMADIARSFALAVPQARSAAYGAHPLATANLNESQALAVLASAGLRTVPHRVVHSAGDAAQAAHDVGLPVVLKVVSRDITHKSDVGGVMLGLRDAQAVRSGYTELLERVALRAPAARIEGVLVAPMLPSGVECVLGVQRDPVFGPMVMFGLGGVFVEVFGDVALRSAPVTDAQALEMMLSVRAWPLLCGARGRSPVDTSLLASQIAALSRLAVDAGDSLNSIDINPFVALPAAQGGGCAVDAVIVTQPNL